MKAEVKFTRADNGWIVEYRDGTVVEQGYNAEIAGADERGYWKITASYVPADKHGTALR